MGYWRKAYRDKIGNSDFIEGVKAALQAYAYWKDGVQYVGCGMMTLESTIKEVEKELSL